MMHSTLSSGRSAAAAQQIKSQCAGLRLGSRQIGAPSQAPQLHAIRHQQLHLAPSRLGVRRQRASIARPKAESGGASSGAVGAAGSDAPNVPKTSFFDGLERPIGATGQEWHPLLALVIFALGYFNHVTLNSGTLFKAFAIFQVASSAVAILFNEVRFDKMSSVVCPAVLAMGVVQPGIDPGNVTLGILGTYLSYEQKVVPFWPMTLSLFGALYRGLGNEWITAAYCVLSVNGLWKAREADPGFKEHKANLLTIPVLAVSAFVATRGLIPLWTTALGLGEVARSTYALLHRLWHEHA